MVDFSFFLFLLLLFVVLVSPEIIEATPSIIRKLTSTWTNHTPPASLSVPDFFHDGTRSSYFGAPLAAPNYNISSTFGPQYCYMAFESNEQQQQQQQLDEYYTWNNGVDYFIFEADTPISAIHAGVVVAVRNMAGGTTVTADANVNSSSFAYIRPETTLIVIKHTLAIPFHTSSSSSLSSATFHGLTMLKTFYSIFAGFSTIESGYASVGSDVGVGDVILRSGANTFLHLEVWLEGNCSLRDQRLWNATSRNKVYDGSCYTGYDPAVHPFLFVGSPYGDDPGQDYHDDERDSTRHDQRVLYQVEKRQLSSSPSSTFAVRLNMTRAHHLNLDSIRSNLGNFSFNLKEVVTETVEGDESNNNNNTTKSKTKNMELISVKFQGIEDLRNLVSFMGMYPGKENFFLNSTSKTAEEYSKNDVVRIWYDFEFTVGTLEWFEAIDIYGFGIKWVRPVDELATTSSASQSSAAPAVSPLTEPSSSAGTSTTFLTAPTTTTTFDFSSVNNNSSTTSTQVPPETNHSPSSPGSPSSESGGGGESTTITAEISSSSSSSTSSSLNVSTARPTSASSTLASSSTSFSTASSTATTAQPVPTTQDSASSASSISDTDAAAIASGSAVVFFASIFGFMCVFYRKWLRASRTAEEGEIGDDPDAQNLIAVSSPRRVPVDL